MQMDKFNYMFHTVLDLVMSASLSEFLYMFILFKARAVKKQNNKKRTQIFLK